MVWYFHLFKNFPVYCDPHSQRLWHSQSRGVFFFFFFLLFLASRNCCLFWLLTPDHSDFCFNHLNFSELDPSLSFLIDIDTFDYIGPNWLIQNNWPISRFFVQSDLQNLFCHIGQHIFKFQTLGHL